MNVFSLFHAQLSWSLKQARLECIKLCLCAYQRPSRRGSPGDIRGHGARFVNFVQ